MSGEIHFSQASGIATLSLSNPDKLNAVDADMWRALQARMSALNADPEVRCVILRGAGDKAFAAGGDIEEFLVVRATVDDALHYHEELVAAALDAIRACPVPTVAMIQGACIGGGLEIAGCCDIRIAGEELHPVGRIKDFLPYATKIKASGAQAVLTGNWGNDLTLLIKAARFLQKRDIL